MGLEIEMSVNMKINHQLSQMIRSKVVRKAKKLLTEITRSLFVYCIGNTFESIETPEWKFQVIIARKIVHLKEVRAKFLPDNGSKLAIKDYFQGFCFS